MSELDYKIGYLIGISFSDASINFDNYNQGWRFDLQCCDKEMVNFIQICFNDIFQRKLIIRKIKRIKEHYKDVYQISTYISKIKDFFVIKNINNKERKRGFVAAIFDAEGYSCLRPRRSLLILIKMTNLEILNTTGLFIREVSNKTLDFSLRDVTYKRNPRWKKIYELYIKGEKLKKDNFFSIFDTKIARKRKGYSNV